MNFRFSFLNIGVLLVIMSFVLALFKNPEYQNFLILAGIMFIFEGLDKAFS